MIALQPLEWHYGKLLVKCFPYSISGTFTISCFMLCLQNLAESPLCKSCLMIGVKAEYATQLEKPVHSLFSDTPRPKALLAMDMH